MIICVLVNKEDTMKVLLLIFFFGIYNSYMMLYNIIYTRNKYCL